MMPVMMDANHDLGLVGGKSSRLIPVHMRGWAEVLAASDHRLKEMPIERKGRGGPTTANYNPVYTYAVTHSPAKFLKDAWSAQRWVQVMEYLFPGSGQAEFVGRLECDQRRMFLGHTLLGGSL